MRKVLIPTVLLFAGFAVSAYANSVSSCESAVRHQVNRQFMTGAHDFAINTVNQNYGRNDFVSGTFFLTRDHAHLNPYQFTCRLNDTNGHVRTVAIGPSATAYVPPAVTSSGAASRVMTNQQIDLNNCQGAVDQNLHDRGYNTVQINSINQETGPRRDYISGSVSAMNGYGTSSFGFSCRVNLNTGNVKSVDVFQR